MKIVYSGCFHIKLDLYNECGGNYIGYFFNKNKKMIKHTHFISLKYEFVLSVSENVFTAKVVSSSCLPYPLYPPFQ